MIPTWHTDWPAGGATFWLNGDLNPTQLYNTSIQNEQCFAYVTNSSVLDTMNWTYASCPWAGYAYLRKYFEVPSIGASHQVSYKYQTFVQSLAVEWADGIDIVFAVENVRTWAVASNIAIAAFARHIANLDWPEALYLAPKIRGGPRSKWIFRQSNATTAAVGGRVPIVRTQCFIADRYADYLTGLTPPTSKQMIPVRIPSCPYQIAVLSPSINSSPSYRTSVAIDYEPTALPFRS